MTGRAAPLDTPAASDPAEGSARDRLLRAAERLFARRGFDGVSVRDIAAAAEVNSASVAYYFGGKEGLLSEVYRTHCGKLNEERLRLLEAARNRGQPSLEAVLEAFIRPALLVTTDPEGGTDFIRLRAVLSGENSALLDRLVAENFDRSSSVFIAALGACLPHLAETDVCWRFHFLLGTIYYTAAGPHRVRALSEGRCDPSDPDAVLREIIPFLAAAFRAPAATSSRRS